MGVSRQEKILWDTIIKESSWTSIRKARVQSLLAVISKIANDLNIDLIFKNGIICKNSAKQNFISVSFENSKFKIPYNSIDVLDTRYSNWKTKIKIYRYCHRLEKPAFSLLSLSIKVNEEGKLII